MANVDRIAFNAKYHGSRPAVACGDRVLDWRAFDALTNRVANGLLARGLRNGDRAAILMGNSIEMLAILWGVSKAGAVVVPLSMAITADQRRDLLGDCEPAAIIADRTAAAEIGDAPAPGEAVRFALGGTLEGWEDGGALLSHADAAPVHRSGSMADTEIIIYSSGTTGRPKGIDLSHRARLIYALGYGPLMHVGPESVILCATPLYANGAWITMLPAIYWGACTVILPKFTPDEFCRAAAKHHATHAFLVPTQASMIAEAPETGAGVAMSAVVVGAGRLDQTLRHRLRDVLGGADVFVCYGMTEGFITLATPEQLDSKPGTVGIPICGGDTRIIDLETGREAAPGATGEIVGYGSGLMKGYFRKEALSREIVWLDENGRTYIRTGDVGRMDEDGHLFLADRLKDMIKSGGLNIYASDLESVFAAHPDVLEAAAVGAPHEKWGETPVLFARVRPGARVTEAELQAWGNRKLASFQKVSRVIFRDDFPRGAYDKVLKRALRAELV